jgi:26S proteasome regulatory subunit N1
MEVQRLGKLADSDVVDDRNYERVCLYLLRCADYVSDPDDLATLYHTSYEIYKQQKKYCDALRVALRSGDDDKISELFSDELNVSVNVKWQMCFILGRHKSSFTVEDETMNNIIGNAGLSERFLGIAREMDMMDAKTPEDIYKVCEKVLCISRGNGFV